ncbi:MAG: PaaI family thioesterase [Aquincola sp.]|uniref:PaaI family thioesterase n=1 Tax=uncultured Aquincola sp. TaxID=886556 RepID=UPI0032B2A60A|nr:PaaI family thioesterase [Aquincola sp.]
MDVTQVLEQWERDEQAVRARLRPKDAPRPTIQVQTLTGLEVLQAIFAGELPPPPIGETLDFVPIHMAAGLAVFQGRPLRRHYNPLGTVHGGWFATLLDSAVGCAVHTLLPAGRSYTTLELKLNLVRALTDATPLVRAEGRIIHAGRQVSTAEGRIVGPDGQLYAHATTTCLVLEPRS